MARPSTKTDAVVDEVVERLCDGETMVSIFMDEHLPTKRGFNKWRLKDKDMDNRVFDAMKQGYLVHADEAAQTQLVIMRGEFTGDPRQAQAAVTAANNLGHQALAKLSKLDNRYKDRQEVTHTGPMVIGWEEPVLVEDQSTKYMPDNVLDHITNDDVAN